jgi:hypothetical protein
LTAPANGCFSQRQAENRNRHDDEIDDQSGDCNGNGASFAEQVAENGRTHERNCRSGRSQCRQYALAQRKAKYEMEQQKNQRI